MVQAWFMDDYSDDQRKPHKKNSSADVTLKELADLGVLYWKLNADRADDDPELKKIRDDRGYNYHDVITCTPEKLPNYEEKIKHFFEEHLHSDEEIRYILDGSGYFDVRDKKDQWIRIFLEKGDMIVLPAGIYHRFTLDEKNYIKAMRLFCGEPVWTPINRPADDHPSRRSHINNFVKG